MNTIEKGWKSYESSTVKPEASDAPRAVLRDTFYGGAIWLLAELVSCKGSGQDAVATLLNGVRDELLAFMAAREAMLEARNK